MATIESHARRLQQELASAGGRVSLGTSKSGRELGLQCGQQKRRFRVQTTAAPHHLPVAPNLLAQRFTVPRPAAVWTAASTYVHAATARRMSGIQGGHF